MAQNYHGIRAIGTLLGKNNYSPWSGKVKAAPIVSFSFNVWSIVNKTRIRLGFPPNVAWNRDHSAIINQAAIDKATKLLGDFVANIIILSVSDI